MPVAGKVGQQAQVTGAHSPGPLPSRALTIPAWWFAPGLWSAKALEKSKLLPLQEPGQARSLWAGATQRLAGSTGSTSPSPSLVGLGLRPAS